MTQALAAAPPSTGSVLQQSTPAPAAPVAPGSVLSLPSPKVQRSESTATLRVRRLRIEGNTLLPKAVVSALAKPLEGRTVTLRALDALAARLTDRYHAAGYPLAYVYVPAQRVRAGVVTLKVIEPHFDRILIQGHTRLRASVARRTLGVSRGQPIAEAPLSRGLLLLERTPGVRVAGTLVPGAAPATSSLEVKLHGQPLAQASLGVDNAGGAYTGRTRGTFAASLANPFGYGSQLAVNALTTEGGLLHAGGFSVLSPNLWNGLRLALYGSRTVYRLGGDFAALEQSGQANQYGLSLRYPLILRPGRLLQVSLDVLRDDFTQTTASVGSQSRSHIDLVRLNLSGAYADRWGGMNTAGLSVSHGQLLLDSAAARAADAAGPQAAGVFWVGQFNLGRRQRLPARFALDVSLSGQLASRNLDGSQQFYLGGPSAVMSYPVGEAGGDEGVLLRTRLSHRVPLARLPGNLKASLLAQAGQVWVGRFSYPGVKANDTLYRAGAGVGLNYRWRHRVSASVSYVHQVGPARASAGPDHAGEIWASLKLSG